MQDKGFRMKTLFQLESLSLFQLLLLGQNQALPFYENVFGFCFAIGTAMAQI